VCEVGLQFQIACVLWVLDSAVSKLSRFACILSLQFLAGKANAHLQFEVAGPQFELPSPPSVNRELSDTVPVDRLAVKLHVLIGVFAFPGVVDLAIFDPVHTRASNCKPVPAQIAS
jgi:hypothetical protein